MELRNEFLLTALLDLIRAGAAEGADPLVIALDAALAMLDKLHLLRCSFLSAAAQHDITLDKFTSKEQFYSQVTPITSPPTIRNSHISWVKLLVLRLSHPPKNLYTCLGQIFTISPAGMEGIPTIFLVDINPGMVPLQQL